MTLSATELSWVALAGLAAGLVNALAGGGSLISFPLLIGLGLPPLLANVTNTLALLPGYVGGTLAQRRQLAGQGRRLRQLLPSAALGGLLGGLLLLHTGAQLLDRLVPWLILCGSLLLAIQEPLRTWVLARSQRQGTGLSERWAVGPLLLAAVYGGYFGAGLSVILLALLAVVLDDDLNRLNGLKQVLAFATNLAAALLFVATAPLSWPVAAVMACGTLVGGALGGRLAGAIDPEALRTLVVGLGLVVALVYFLR